MGVTDQFGKIPTIRQGRVVLENGSIVWRWLEYRLRTSWIGTWRRLDLRGDGFELGDTFASHAGKYIS